MRARLAVGLIAVLPSTSACTPTRSEPTATPIPVAEATVAPGPDASAEVAEGPATAAPDPRPAPPELPKVRSYEELCGDIHGRRSAGTAAATPALPAPSASTVPARRTIDVRFHGKETREPGQPRNEPGLYHAFITAPSLRVDRDVFSAAAADPFHCCATTHGAQLDVDCGASGIDVYQGGGSARQEGDELVLRWCTTTPTRVEDQGELHVPLHGATARFIATKNDCLPDHSFGQ